MLLEGALSIRIFLILFGLRVVFGVMMISHLCLFLGVNLSSF